MGRGELVRLPASRAARGRVQQGERFGVVVQADELLGLSTSWWLRTPPEPRPAPWRPLIEIADATHLAMRTLYDPRGRTPGRPQSDPG